MPKDRFLARRNKLRKQLRPEKIDALLVTNETNVTYLTGFTGDSSFLLLDAAGETLISDTRYAIQIEEECPGLNTYIRDSGEKILTSVGKLVKRHRAGTVGFESASLTHAQWQELRETSETAEWVPTSRLVEQLRMIKDAAEVSEIRNAVEIAQRAFRLLQASLYADMTEREASYELEAAVRRFGGEGMAFESIIAAGDRAALPHYHPGSVPAVGSDFLLVDWGAVSSGGYRSDLTRVMVTGKIRPKLEKLYRVVLTAQQAALEKMAPGIACTEVDAAARNVIEEAGYGKHFGHGLGHGIGLEIHEGPRLSPISDDVLKAGMVVTVEPGIYLPGWGGVRIEDDVLITRDGCEVLTSVPKEWDEVPSL